MYPKIKIQVPAMFTAGEINSLQGGPLTEPAYDLVIHTIVNGGGLGNVSNNSNEQPNNQSSNLVEEVAEDVLLANVENLASNQPNTVTAQVESITIQSETNTANLEEEEHFEKTEEVETEEDKDKP